MHTQSSTIILECGKKQTELEQSCNVVLSPSGVISHFCTNADLQTISTAHNQPAHKINSESRRNARLLSVSFSEPLTSSRFGWKRWVGLCSLLPSQSRLLSDGNQSRLSFVLSVIT
jgi:hypothetical protein